jgi:hypothetical protein
MSNLPCRRFVPDGIYPATLPSSKIGVTLARTQ